jgi:hypothetical protein
LATPSYTKDFLLFLLEKFLIKKDFATSPKLIFSLWCGMPQLVRVHASHCRWFTNGPFSAQLLLPSHYDSVLNRTWNAGRHAPGVTLTLGFDAPVTALKLCPNMKPAEGFVGLVVVLGNGQRIAHRTMWRESEWVTIAIPTPVSELLIEFMESPSWIALHAVRVV